MQRQRAVQVFDTYSLLNTRGVLIILDVTIEIYSCYVFSLISEVSDLEGQIKTLYYQLECARTGHLGLQKVRTELEDEARIKRKTLWIDTVKCQNIRAHYPSINALIGY